MDLSRFDVAGLLDHAVATQRTASAGDWTDRGGGASWRASSLGSCPRGLMLGRIGVPQSKTFDPKTLRAFALGDLLGEWVVDQFDALGILVGREVPYSDPERDVAGHADAVIQWPGDPDRDEAIGEPSPWVHPHVGVEVKTSNSRSMQYIADEGPKREHKLQVGTYMLMSDTEDPRRMLPKPSAWVITYVGKDYAGMLTFDANDGWKRDAAAALDGLNQSYALGALPVCTCTTAYGGTGPFYCGYLDRAKDVQFVRAIGDGTSKSKKDLASKVFCCARSQEGLERAMALWATSLEGKVT